VCGEEDQLTPVKYSVYLQRQIAGSELRIVAGAGHYVMREKAEIVNSYLSEWIGS
jgi:pimeloyl-ACP methyl ester carboxylesterase